MHESSEIIERVCDALMKNEIGLAGKIADECWPFEPVISSSRQYTPYQSMCVFYRDGFKDRYSGEKLINPGVLRILNVMLPNSFPYHTNWKMSETHIVYWKLFPTIDHVMPVARGGTDEESNWVSTSQLRNSAKSNWTLDELGWTIQEAGNISHWDGLSSQMIELTELTRLHQKDPYILKWRNATLRVINSG